MLDTYYKENARFIAYLVLGILVLNALKRSGVLRFRSVVITLIICILYASSDEFYQIFVHGRGSQVRGVFIDSGGAVVGIGLYFIISRVKNKVMINS